MNVSCVLCERQIDTKNEEVAVTVSWVLNDLVKRNNVKFEKNAPRVVKICKKCWDNVLKNKPEGSDYYWFFNKGV